MGRSKKEIEEEIRGHEYEINRLKDELARLPKINMNSENVEFSVGLTTGLKVEHWYTSKKVMSTPELTQTGREFGKWLEKHSSIAFFNGLSEYVKEDRWWNPQGLNRTSSISISRCDSDSRGR